MADPKTEQISTVSVSMAEAQVIETNEVAQPDSVPYPTIPWGEGSAPSLPSVDDSDNQASFTIQGPPLLLLIQSR
jgi:hypothetical protein